MIGLTASLLLALQGQIVTCADNKPLNEPPCSYVVTQNQKGLIQPDDAVVAWLRAKHNGGAVPIRHFLAGPRVINDTYGLFFYDPDGGFVAAYEKAYGYQLHGYRNGVMVVRHEDGTLFSALTGLGIEGPRKGHSLPRIASMTTTWGHWMLLHPESTAYDLFDGKRYPIVDLPSEPTTESVQSRGEVDSRLPAGTRVLGVSVNGERMAFPLDGLPERAVLRDKVGGWTVVVFWYGPTHTAVAWRAVQDGVLLDFHVDPIGPATAPYKDRNTSTRWSLAGRGIDGLLRGEELTWVDSIQCKWLAWSAEHPETKVHGMGKPSAGKPSSEPGKAVEPATPTDAKKRRTAREPRPFGSGRLVSPERLGSLPGTFAKDATLVLEVSGHDDETVTAAATKVLRSGLALGYWFSIGRNEALADAHPEWVATLQGHEDWRRDHPSAAVPRDGEVTVAWPWVPIRYAEAFNVHLELLRRRLDSLPVADTVFLNDLQGPPSACGCGNVLCRWATDYTLQGADAKRRATPLGPDAAARFVSAVQRIAKGSCVIPVWVTECEDADTVADGACHGVGCYRGACWREFDKQFAPLRVASSEIALLLPYEAFGRDLPRFEPRAAWVHFAVQHLRDREQQHGRPLPTSDLVAVLQGYGHADVDAQISAAKAAGVSRMLIAEHAIPQSFEARLRK
ncbi:MAG: DUF3179 domain-containing protein [Planctomycetes bacterium]|nr:DUF3179 domain-containing protein [Planctomycetota bacterium]